MEKCPYIYIGPLPASPRARSDSASEEPPRAHRSPAAARLAEWDPRQRFPSLRSPPRRLPLPSSPLFLPPAQLVMSCR